MLKSLRRYFDRNFLNLRLHQQLGRLIVIYVLCSLFFFGVLSKFGGSAPEVKNWFWWVYAHMVDAGTIIESAKVNARVVNICGIAMNILNIFFFGGIFISLFTNFFEEAAKRVQNGQARDKINKEHNVILGWDVVGASIVHKLMAKKKDRKPIVILSSRNPEDIRADIASYDMGQTNDEINNLLKQIYILNGSFTNRNELNDDALMLRKTQKIYILGENNSTRNDSDTISTALHFDNLINDKQKKKINSPIPLIADIRSFSLFSQLKTKVISKDVDKDFVDRVIFNFYENWARRIWSHIPEDKDDKYYYPLAYVPVTQNNFVHLIIIGFGQMGQALAVEAARVAHYGTGKNTRITVIDNNMAERKTKFVATFALKHNKDSEIYSWYEENGYKADVEFVFKDNSAEDEEIREFLVETAKEAETGNQIPTLAICFSKLDAAFETALSLPIEFTTAEVKSFTDKRIPVLLRNESDYRRSSKESPVKDNNNETAENNGAAANQEKGHKRDIDTIDLFGNLKECIGFDEKTETFAKVLNALYNVFESEEQNIVPDLCWKETSEYNRWASRHQASAFVERLRATGYKLQANTDNQNTVKNRTAEAINKEKIPNWQLEGQQIFGDSFKRFGKAEHNRWSLEKWMCGYKYGEKTDKNLYRHKDLRDYSELNNDEQNKDMRSVALAKWILENYCGVTVEKQ